MTSWADLIAKVDGQAPHRATVRVLLETEPFLRLHELRTRLEQYADVDADITEQGPQQIVDEIAGLLDEYDETEFIFEALPAGEYDDLQWDHPHADGRRGVADSFWPVVMARCCVQPEGASEADFEVLQRRLNSRQWRLLKGAVIEANEGGADLRPLRAATATTRGGRPTSTTAPPEASPSPSTEEDG